MTFFLESRILLIYTIKLFLSVYTCACMLKPLFETSMLILLDKLRICIGSLTHVRSLPACKQWEVGVVRALRPSPFTSFIKGVS